MRTRILLCLCLSSVALATACGGNGGDDDSSDVGTDAAADAQSDGSSDVGGDADDASDASTEQALVQPNADGDLELVVDGRTLIAFPRSFGPRLHTFEETWSTSVGGIFEFSRSNEEQFALGWGDVRVEDGVTLVDLSDGDGTITATLSAGPHESVDATVVRLEWNGLEADASSIALRCDDDGSFHGFGEQYNGTDQRGEAFQIFLSEQGIGREGGPLRSLLGDEHTTYFPMPYLLDVRGFGALWMTDYRVDVDLCATDENLAWFEVVGPEPMEIVVFHGPTVPDVISQLHDLLGRPVRPPDWAWDLWVSIQGGTEDVLAELDALEAAEIPLGAVWTQDWTGYRMNIGGGSGVQYRWAVGTDLYEDLPGLVAEIQDRGYRFLGYANPFVDAGLDDFFPEMDERGLLIQNEAGESYTFSAPNGVSSLPDFTNPETVEFVRDALIAMVEDYGMDGWMSDFGEVLPLDAVLSDGTDPLAYHNHFPVDWHGTVRQALDTVRPDGDYVTFGRSGWTGVHGVAMIHWVGDQEADWSDTDGLPTVVPAMINLGLAGQPFVTHDIGGFSGGPSTKELYLRWTELGAFTPVMRTHEGNNKDANWNWNGGPDADDPETIAHFRRFARIHEALEADLIEAADQAEETGMPMVRHTMLMFPDDAATYDLAHQYMLGDALLVAPVVEEGATEWELYLPEGIWYHVWTGDEYVSTGEMVTVDAPVGSPPVFSLGIDRSDLRAVPE